MTRRSDERGLEPGEVVGHYVIVRRIGGGGASKVYEAADSRTSERVALKLLHREALESPVGRARVEREVRSVARLESASFPRVLDFDLDRERVPFIALELLVGRDLCERLDDEGALRPDVAIHLAIEAARGLALLHAAHVVHRDVKPANLFLCDSGPLKIIDFGAAKLTQPDAAKLTRTLSVFGTPEYMSPEQVRSTRDVDSRTDIWSLGVVLYECLSGRPPFRGPATKVFGSIVHEPIPSLRALAPDVSPELESVVLQMLERDVERRLPSALVVVERLVPLGRPPIA